MEKIAGNVFIDTNSEYNISQLNESTFLFNLFAELKEVMSNFNDFTFYIHSAGMNCKYEPASLRIDSPNKILLLISDEGSHIPYEYSKYYYAIFKAYLPSENLSANNIFPFPLGYVKNLPVLPVIKSSKRKHSVFFSGNLNKNRIDLYKHISGIKYIPNKVLNYINLKKRNLLKNEFDNFFPKSFIRFTDGFKHGLDSNEYANYLNNSKIILCPGGFVSPETFRHFEAMRAGGVIISSKLPDLYFYKNSPIIQVENWEDGFVEIRDLVNNPERLDNIQQETLKWWNNVCSEPAVANYIKEKITLLARL